MHSDILTIACQSGTTGEAWAQENLPKATIESMTMEYRGLYVSATPDCEPNEGGYYCQVYADEDYGDQIDDFCIHPDELEENDDIKHWGKVNIDGSYRYYVENGVISPENSDI